MNGRIGKFKNMNLDIVGHLQSKIETGQPSLGNRLINQKMINEQGEMGFSASFIAFQQKQSGGILRFCKALIELFHNQADIGCGKGHLKKEFSIGLDSAGLAVQQVLDVDNALEIAFQHLGANGDDVRIAHGLLKLI
ncbi:MAG: hypothetical protein BWY83_00408 [bacterium ADurb.Bin478]|nr:MAG: hypothetical protein BWY83_00408 [bacterium ADurb.Bin478]